MFDAFRQLVSELTGGDKPPRRFAESDYRVAAAALLIHAASVDGGMSEAERDKLRTVLKRCFELDDAAADALVAEATKAEQEAIDLYRFTRLLNRSLDEDGRRRMVEMMWQVVYTDRQVTEFEENLIWRAADLLGVSSRERIELRQRVANSRGEDA